MNRIAAAWNWLFQKAPEITRLSGRDVRLAEVVLRIQRDSTGKAMTTVLLHDIEPIHRIDRDSALEKCRQRAEAVRARKQAMLEHKYISNDTLVEVMPSVSPIRVIKDQGYIAFEGNGRLFALKQVFDRDDRITVDVEEYRLRPDSVVLEDVRELRKRNRADRADL